MALIEKLTAIADAIRNKTGYTSKLTLDEMPDMIEAIEGGGATTLDNTYILVDEDGYEVPAVLTEEEVELTATANDIRIGTVAVTDEGVVTGEKEIPSYHTTEGKLKIPAGGAIEIPMFSDKCRYTKFQALICAFETSLDDSVSTSQVSINDRVYAVNSSLAISTVTVDPDAQIINLGVNNDSNGAVVLRFVTLYKEE